MRWESRLAFKGFVLVSLPLAFMLVFVIILLLVLKNAESVADLEEHSKLILSTNETLTQNFYAAGKSLFIYYLNKSTVVGKQFDVACADMTKDLEELQQLSASDDPALKEPVRRLTLLVPETISLLKSAKRKVDSGTTSLDLLGVQDVDAKIEALTDQLIIQTAEINKLERQRRANLPQAKQESRWIIREAAFAGVAAGCVLTFLLSLFYSKQITGRLSVVEDNSRKLGSGEALNAPIEGADEIASLDKVFHKMAADLNEAGRRERALVDNAADAIFSLNDKGEFVKINPAAEDLWGFSRLELIKKNFQSLVEPDDSASLRQKIEDVKKNGGTLSMEVQTNGSCEKVVFLQLSAHWSETDELLFCVAHDITDRKQVDRMKQEFVAMVSHDLRSPLTSIKIVLNLLQQGAYGNLNEVGMARVRAVEESTGSLIRLTNELLELEKAESGQIALNYSTVALQTLADAAFATIKPDADRAGVQIEIADLEWCHVRVDRQRIVQVLVNLLSNAVKFSPAQTTIRLSAAAKENHALVTIEDEGRGIPEQQLSTIFSRFRQVKSEDAEHGKGFGLGLAICKTIVEQHSGLIGAENNSEKGSTFWFTIPLDCQAVGSGSSNETADI
jgi:PAS domain S-box-containing protein